MFILIWRGRGFLVLGFAILGVLVTSLFTALLGGGHVAGHAQTVAIGLGLVAAAIPVWVFGRRWNAPQPDRVLMDQQTGQQVVVTWKPRHTLYYVPMQYWSFALGAVGALTVLGGLTGS